MVFENKGNYPVIPIYARGVTTLLGKIPKSLEEMGYHRNEYNWCVMKNIIDNK